MSLVKINALAIVLLLATTTSYAVDHQVDQMVHTLESEVEALLHEIHLHHPGTHLDTDAHAVQSQVQVFHQHVLHGDGHHLLRQALVPLSNAVHHLNATARSMGHWDYSHGHGWWHSTLNEHVRTEILHVNSAYNNIYYHLYAGHHYPH